MPLSVCSSARDSLKGEMFNAQHSLNEPFELQLKVRDYELDQYGLVQNAVYSRYCDHARHELFDELGINSESLSAANASLALAELSLKFLSPLKSGDVFIVTCRISGSSAMRLFFEHNIYKLPHKEPVLEAKGIVLCLDKNDKPTKFPARFRNILNLFMRNRGL